MDYNYFHGGRVTEINLVIVVVVVVIVVVVVVYVYVYVLKIQQIMKVQKRLGI
jgi:hypothetical protein